MSAAHGGAAVVGHLDTLHAPELRGHLRAVPDDDLLLKVSGVRFLETGAGCAGKPFAGPSGPAAAPDEELEKVLSYVRIDHVASLVEVGKEDGGSVLIDGGRPDGNDGAGFFYAPTVLTDVALHSGPRPAMTRRVRWRMVSEADGCPSTHVTSRL